MMRQFLHKGPPLEVLTTEFVLFIIVVGLSLIIYFKTKEIFALTKHQGIQHFRNVFLFFALAYSVRLLHVFIMMSRGLFSSVHPRTLEGITIFFVGYFSTLAILSLAFMAVNRYVKTQKYYSPYLLHGFALLLSITVYVTRSQPVLLIFQTMMFVGALVMLLLSAQKRSKGFLSKNHLTFFLLFVFWVLNTLVFTKGMFPAYIRMPIYLLSAAVFLLLFWKVHQRLPSNGKKKG